MPVFFSCGMLDLTKSGFRYNYWLKHPQPACNVYLVKHPIVDKSMTLHQRLPSWFLKGLTFHTLNLERLLPLSGTPTNRQGQIPSFRPVTSSLLFLLSADINTTSESEILLEPFPCGFEESILNLNCIFIPTRSKLCTTIMSHFDLGQAACWWTTILKICSRIMNNKASDCKINVRLKKAIIAIVMVESVPKYTS